MRGVALVSNHRPSALGALALAGALLGASCYAPSPGSGTYKCGAGDGTCPSSQHCTCGLCVNKDSQAVCSFRLDLGESRASVLEHQSFPLTVTALTRDGVTQSSGFHGTVTLGFALPNGTPWGDVTPSTVKLRAGSAQLMVSLNRETVPSQAPSIIATFGAQQPWLPATATATGRSPGITVTAPQFDFDPVATVRPAAGDTPFGWANETVSQPNVVAVYNGYRMYFVGTDSTLHQPTLGVATSSDGSGFTPVATPLFRPASVGFYSQAVLAPSAFLTASYVSVAFVGVGDPPAAGDLGVGHSIDGIAPLTVSNGGRPVLRRGDCPLHYCDDFVGDPNVIPDPFSTPADGAISNWLMFFAAIENVPGPDSPTIASIARASSTDGINFTPAVAPVLVGSVEIEMLRPKVVVDGSVLKMWYSYSQLSDRLAVSDPCGFRRSVGYATSADGFFWIRSPRNPVIDPRRIGGWTQNGDGVLIGSVVPAADGTVTLYYSLERPALRADLSGYDCIENGIGRATRQ